MAQFDVYKAQGGKAEMLLDLQDEMLEGLSTRVVAPLVIAGTYGPPMKIVNPSIFIQGKEYVLLAHLLAAVPTTALGERIGSVPEQRSEIIAAMDMLFTGI